MIGGYQPRSMAPDKTNVLAVQVVGGTSPKKETPDILTNVIQAVRTANPGRDEGKVPKAAKKIHLASGKDAR